VQWDNGTATLDTLDQANDQPWTWYQDGYDSQGRITSKKIQWDDGRSTLDATDQVGNQSWTWYQDGYDSQGRLDYKRVQWDDGRSTLDDLDQAGTQPWSWYQESQGHPNNYQKALWDDGSFSYSFPDTNWNPDAQEPLFWTRYFTIRYDERGRFDYSWVRWSDGRSVYHDVDQLNTETWTSYTAEYLASGALKNRQFQWDHEVAV
jgi:hypothetical protein